MPGHKDPNDVGNAAESPEGQRDEMLGDNTGSDGVDDDARIDQTSPDDAVHEWEDVTVEHDLTDTENVKPDVEPLASDVDNAIDPALLEAGRILTPEELDGLRSVEGIIQRQQSLIEKRLSDIEEIQEQARKEGYEQGSREAAELVATIARANQREKEQASDRLVDVVMSAMRMLIDRYDHAELVAEAVNKILHEQGLRTREQAAHELTLMVHPSLYDDVHQHLMKILGSGELDNLLYIKGDQQLPPERSLLVSPIGTVELDLEQQLESLRNGLLGATAPEIIDTNAVEQVVVDNPDRRPDEH